MVSGRYFFEVCDALCTNQIPLAAVSSTNLPGTATTSPDGVWACAGTIQSVAAKRILVNAVVMGEGTRRARERPPWSKTCPLASIKPPRGHIHRSHILLLSRTCTG